MINIKNLFKKIFIFLFLTIFILFSLKIYNNIKLQNSIINFFYKKHPSSGEKIEKLKVYDKKDFNGKKLILCELYDDMGGGILILLLSNGNGDFEFLGTVLRAMSASLSASYLNFENKTIIFGDYRNKNFDYKNGKVYDIKPYGVKIYFEDNNILDYKFLKKETFLIITDDTSDITNIELVDKNKNSLSDYIVFDKINVEDRNKE